MHKLQELFHDFANRISAMNNAVAMPALTYLNKDLKSFNSAEKKDLLKRLDEAFVKSSDIYQDVIDTEDNLITQILYVEPAFDVTTYFYDIMDIIHEAAHSNTKLMIKLDKYKLDEGFESYIKPILGEILEFDKKMPLIAELLEKAKDVLRDKGLYPKKKNEEAE